MIARWAGLRGWLLRQWREWICSSDFALGLAVGAAVGSVAAVEQRVRADASAPLIAEASVAAVVLAIVLAALTLVAVFFDDLYRAVLERASGWRSATRPYLVIAMSSGAAVVSGLTGAILWSVFPAVVQAGWLAFTTFTLVWSTMGAIQLVEITMFHGEQRAKLRQAIQEARRQRLSAQGTQEEERRLRGAAPSDASATMRSGKGESA
jgi:hypothetical protein